MFNTELSLFDDNHDEGLLNDIFYSILPSNLFKLKLTFFNRIHYCTEEGVVLVQSGKHILNLLHEIAHVVETPNARLFTEDFGLKFAKVGIDHLTAVPTFRYYKTDIPFKRELRVFGIQYALHSYVKYLGVRFEQPTWDTMYGVAKASLVVKNGVRRPYMTNALWENKPEVYKTIRKTLLSVGEKYRHDRDYLVEALARKFEYITNNRPKVVD